MKHEVRRFGRRWTWAPLDPQGCVIRVDTQHQRIERDFEIAESAIISLRTSYDGDGGMVPNRSLQFAERPVSSFGRRLTRWAIGDEPSTR
ncbi:MAG: hypothetical protein SVG88_11080 [Halobacteriales archaeon]|nr:hypothetical protein [Halobacteriales archaeon]